MPPRARAQSPRRARGGNARQRSATPSRSRSASSSRSVLNAGVPGNKVRRLVGPFGGPAQSEVVVTANVFQTQLTFDNIATPFVRLPDVANMDPQNFTIMTDRVGLGTGSNTLMTNGVFMGQATFASTPTDPFHRNFVGFKMDHPGWNCCNPRQWNANATQFVYVKSSPVVLEITLPDPPIVKALPVTITRPAVFRSAADITGYQALNMVAPNTSDGVPMWNETRPTGAWQYIIIPPQRGASLRLDQIVGFEKWQQLLQIGYKPQTCRGKTYKCVCTPKGEDATGQLEIASKLNALGTAVVPGTIPAYNNQGQGLGLYNTVHKAQETDWCCQYSRGPFVDTPLLAALTAAQQEIVDFSRQGFDVVAFGSGIVFQFVQYAPPAVDGTSTACRQVLPLTLTVHSKTTFRQLKTASQDIGQVSTLPIVGGV